MKLNFLLARLSLAWLSLAALLSGEPGTGCRPIETDIIYGRDLAAIPAFAAIPPDVQVGHASVPGLQRVFTPPELRRLAREYGLAPRGLLSNVCFVWPVEPLSPAAIEQAIEKTLAGRDPQIEVVSWSLTSAPRGELVFPLTGLAVSSDKPSVWRGYVVYGEAKHFGIWANVRISIGETHLILNSLLRAGEEPDGTQVRLEAYRGPLPREQAFTNVAQLKNVVARHDLQPGITLLESMFEAPLDIRGGELVEVSVENGAARIDTQGIAKQTGRRGDIISVANPKTGRAYRARVTGKGSVTVIPGGSVGLVGEEDKGNKS
jgi:flagella basal body P-ring formation protein FlgA